MSATPRQVKYINDILEAGCPIPEHPQFDRPDDSMYKSFEAADAFIKANRHWCQQNAMHYAMSKTIRADEYGEVLNC
jgi:hypothetical protein